MKLSDLSPAIIERIKGYRYDHIIEKHEGPERWASVLKCYEPEILRVNRYDVLLPLPQEHHKNIKILRCIVSNDERSLTLFLKDTTYNPDPEDEMFYVGRIAVCDRFEEEDFFLTILYHGWFIIENKL